MPPYGTIPADRRDTRDQDFWQKLIAQYFEKTDERKKAGFENKILQAVLSGGDLSEATQQEQPEGILGGVFDRINPGGTYRGSMANLEPLTQMVLSTVMKQKLMDPAERRILGARADTAEQGVKMGDIALGRAPTETELLNQRKERGEWDIKGLPLEHRGKEIGLEQSEYGLGDLPLDRRAKEIGVARSEAELAREPLNTELIQTRLGITKEQLKQMPTQTQLLLNNLAISRENLKQTQAETGRGGLRTEGLEADIDYKRARAESWKDGGSRNKVTPISATAIEKIGNIMNTYLDMAKKSDWGGYNFTRKNLLSAWEEFKVAVDFDNIPPNQQKQLISQWNTKIGSRNKESSEYDWDPALIEKEKSGELKDGDVRYETAPVIGLDDIWGQLDDVNKQAVWSAWQQAQAERVSSEEFTRKIRERLWGG